jgi:hypothetical protein
LPNEEISHEDSHMDKKNNMDEDNFAFGEDDDDYN